MFLVGALFFWVSEEGLFATGMRIGREFRWDRDLTNHGDLLRRLKSGQAMKVG